MRLPRLLGALSVIGLIPVFYLALEAKPLPAPEPRSSIGHRTAEQGWWGVWDRDVNSRFESGTLTIHQTTANGFAFELDVRSGGNLGSIAGDAVFTGPGQAVFADTLESLDDACRIDFRMAPAPALNIEVEPSPGCGMYAGLGVGFWGTYELQYDGVAESGLFTEAELSALHGVMGERYDGLAASFQIAVEADEALGTPGVRALAGFVRGMGRVNEGIIAKGERGEIWAAYIDPDEDVVRYFATRPEHRVSPPAVVEAWRSRFPEKRVVTHADAPAGEQAAFRARHRDAGVSGSVALY